MNEVVQPINNGEKPVSKHELNRTEALALENMELMALTSHTNMKHAKRFKKDAIKYAKVSLRKFYGIKLDESIFRIERRNAVVFYFKPTKIKFRVEGNQNDVVIYLKGIVYDPEHPDEPYVQEEVLRDFIESSEKTFYNEDEVMLLLRKEK